MVNLVNATGQPEYGDPVGSTATAAVQAQEAKISVTKTADPAFGSKGSLINFTLNVTNDGAASLPHVFVSDMLPAGLTYDSSSAGGQSSGSYVNWTDIGTLSSGQSRDLWIRARIDSGAFGIMINRVDVEAKPEHGGNVTATASAEIEALDINISAHKSADPSFGSPGTLVNFSI
jgi:uncharacterized repeat protein (TIGR01451 family)